MISVTYEGRILLVITDNPPVNALSQPVREGNPIEASAAATLGLINHVAAEGAVVGNAS
jgi:hypothetical protein